MECTHRHSCALFKHYRKTQSLWKIPKAFLKEKTICSNAGLLVLCSCLLHTSRWRVWPDRDQCPAGFRYSTQRCREYVWGGCGEKENYLAFTGASPRIWIMCHFGDQTRNKEFKTTGRKRVKNHHHSKDFLTVRPIAIHLGKHHASNPAGLILEKGGGRNTYIPVSWGDILVAEYGDSQAKAVICAKAFSCCLQCLSLWPAFQRAQGQRVSLTTALQDGSERGEAACLGEGEVSQPEGIWKSKIQIPQGISGFSPESHIRIPHVDRSIQGNCTLHMSLSISSPHQVKDLSKSFYSPSKTLRHVWQPIRSWTP